ncbi:MAG: dTDP-4-dehydrorhamnose 3,5-epimerase [Vulcanimicrobiaceae bacterium]
MDVTPLALTDARLLVPRAFTDDRGFFMETYSSERYRAVGIYDGFVQDNISVSRRGTLRGLHSDPRMAKLVQVLAGEAYDVIVDLRRDSRTYRECFGAMLSAANRTQLYVPPGFLHGYLALADDTIFSYKQSALYDPTMEFGVAWNDPDLAIAWPLEGMSPLLSPKDAANPTLRELGYV